ncbi:MAG: integration host factor subunit alpha [Succinivibrionaceae bacterium]|nr:integration host factor subunit alpha [Succinivibrionaceae bacterium]
MSVTKAEIVNYVRSSCNVRKGDAAKVVNCFFEQLKNALAEGEPVKISGFGSFTVHDKKPRPGRNPRTGEEVEITGRRVVTFKEAASRSRRQEQLS